MLEIDTRPRGYAKGVLISGALYLMPRRRSFYNPRMLLFLLPVLAGIGLWLLHKP